jgi:hypothetical protein
VSPSSTVRVQFSRGLAEASLAGHVRVSYVASDALGASPSPDPEFKASYDAANRALEIRFSKPLEPLRAVKVEILEGLTAFDSGPARPWTLTFMVGN